MKLTRFILMTFLIAAGVFFMSGLFVINQYERAIVLRLGKIEVDGNNQPVIRQPGLNFKIPFITTARIFDIRLQTLDIESSRIVTLEKKDLLVDYYIKWKITNLPTFFKSTGGNIVRIQTLIEQKANDGIRAEFGKRTIKEVVSGERRDIMQILRKIVDSNAESLGVDVIDVRIKRIDLPTEVSSTVFARMRSERQRIATQHRAEGRATAEAIRAQADAEVTILKATANSKSKQIRGAGDAKAAQIYADAYEQDAEFYSFYRSMRAYSNAFTSKQDLLVLDPANKFFKHFSQDIAS